MDNKVAVIVVTYNRKKLLADNLEALLRQSCQADKIYIVDNKSTDGTLEFLEEKGYNGNEKIEIIELVENLGGAGGFFYGLERAKAAGYDWYWLMDDDCLPADNCLERLLGSEFGDYLSPIVLSAEDKATDVWHRLDTGTGLQEVKSIPFNGALVKNNVVDEIGLPKKEFFLFCDDVEYSFRARMHNCALYTNTDAVMYHPKKRYDYVSVFSGRMKIPVFNTRVKQYCYIRNNIYVAQKYGRYLDFHFMKEVIKQIYYALLIDRKSFGTVFYAICHGLTSNFGRTRDFLTHR